MRIAILVAIVLVSAVAVLAQSAEIVKSFEQNKTKYTREHFVSGEDASSGFDYLFYKNGAKIVKVRSIWSATHTNELRIEDLYYDGSSLVLLQRMTGSKRQLTALIKGRNMPLTKKDELYLAASRLVTWTDDKKLVAKTDPRWAETEKFTVEHGTSTLESYDWLKEDK